MCNSITHPSARESASALSFPYALLQSSKERQLQILTSSVSLFLPVSLPFILSLRFHVLSFIISLFDANRQQDGEIEALNRTISNLRDYVVDTGQYLTRDQPFL